MNSNRIKFFIEEYLEKTRLMQVVTSRNNQPWACSVYFAYDEVLNLYWLSKPSRRHSQEIRANKNIAGTIVLPHAPGDDVRGLQFEGTANELSQKKDIEQAMNFYANRYGMDTKRVSAIVENIDGHACYVVRPTLFVLFDEVNFPDNPRQEYVLKQ